ncbi:hypothetical protein [uncultured Roseibium sp.]|uniref:hypothetical protein n=1 Tax=uncultured Roseibium sp. TaxID=1936171 RepID=UPI003216FA88
MPTPVWKPERRNRNIGTAASGHGQSNRMRIPESRQDSSGNWSSYYERIRPDFVKDYRIGDDTIKILYEKPRDGFSSGCSPEDVVHLLSMLPDDEHRFLDYVVFRQPTRKQCQQHPVWGRLIYQADIGNLFGSAIFLEAQELGSKMRWSHKLDIEDKAEFERLNEDGHVFEKTKRHSISQLTETALRNTVLYRTLLHELGHWQHYENDVLAQEDMDLAADLYFAKPSVEKEQYAHGYAEKWAKTLRSKNLIPFAPRDFELPASA